MLKVFLNFSVEYVVEDSEFPDCLIVVLFLRELSLIDLLNLLNIRVKWVVLEFLDKMLIDRDWCVFIEFSTLSKKARWIIEVASIKRVCVVFHRYLH